MSFGLVLLMFLFGGLELGATYSADKNLNNLIEWILSKKEVFVVRHCKVCLKPAEGCPFD